MYQFRYRYYHAQLGRFVGRDPIGYSNAFESLYVYCDNDPIAYMDPTGLAKSGAEWEWHHLLPRAFDKWWDLAGLDRDSPEVGWMLTAADHRCVGHAGESYPCIHPSWNADWERWFNDYIVPKRRQGLFRSKMELRNAIEARLNGMMGKYWPILQKGTGAKLRWQEWNSVTSAAKAAVNAAYIGKKPVRVQFGKKGRGASKLFGLLAAAETIIVFTYVASTDSVQYAFEGAMEKTAAAALFPYTEVVDYSVEYAESITGPIVESGELGRKYMDIFVDSLGGSPQRDPVGLTAGSYTGRYWRRFESDDENKGGSH